jgi:cysteine-S-conjugate beta-lyase
MNIHTKLLRFDAAPGDPTRPTSTPIYQTATFEQESATEFGAYDYTRSGNPTRTVLEKHLADLEHGCRAFAYASGMAALAAVTRLLSPGDQILADEDLYGGAYRFYSRVLPSSGITAAYADASDLDAFAAVITPRTRLIHIESPTNPLIRVLDIRAIAKLAHAAGALLSVDSTMLSPYLQNPLALGADIVVHSGTKYLNGHADVTAGVIAVRDEELAKRLAFLQNAEGTALGPQDCFLLLRGVKTLGCRLDRQQQTAQMVAEFLASHPGVKQVNFPGLPDHPGKSLHDSQSRGPGGVLSIELESREAAIAFVESTKLFTTCVSFGSINSSISLPACMSHASIPAEQRRDNRVPPALVRLSIGLEDTQDLIDDLTAALAPSVRVIARTPAASPA